MTKLANFAAILLPLFSLSATSASASGCKRGRGLHRSELVADNYLKLWNGDYSVLDATVSPDISVHADRLPSAEGSSLLEVNSSQEFLGWVQKSRTGWDEYNFVAYKSAVTCDHIAIRWRLEAVIGADFTLIPGTTLEQGDPVTYNGTDFLVLNERTGLIDEANVAQDLITFFHGLGLTGVTV